MIHQLTSTTITIKYKQKKSVFFKCCQSVGFYGFLTFRTSFIILDLFGMFHVLVQSDKIIWIYLDL